MKKWITVALLTLSLYPYVVLSEQAYTINEVREQANALLETYSTTRTVEVETTTGIYNVSIDIPDVDRVPVLEVSFPSLDHVPSAPQDGEVTTHIYDYLSASYLCSWVVDVNRDMLYGEYKKNTHRVGLYGIDAHADGSPLTMKDSLTFAEQILNYYKMQYGWEFELHNSWSNSRRYNATSGKKGFIPDMDHPVDDTGYYTLEYKQVFHGIPYYDYVRFAYPSKNDRHNFLCLGSFQIDIFSPDCYSYYIYPSVEAAVLEEDVPLCSMETVIKAFKESCKHTSNQPVKLRLVYMSMNDPDDRNGDHLILVPCWILESDNGPEWGGKGYLAIVSAQTGEFVDMYKNDKNGYRDAIWFGWNNIH